MRGDKIMVFNILRGLLLISGPPVGYFFFGHSHSAALVGLGLAALLVVVELVVDQVPLDVLVFGLIGASCGLIFSKVLDWLIFKLNNYTQPEFMLQYAGLFNILLAFLGFIIALKKKNELDLLDKDLIVKGKKNKDIKILDTSVLIDGRICDVVETGFLSGKLLVPRFVLHELQMVADSSDATKRQRGRRGLDMLKRLQEAPGINIKIFDKDYSHIKEVDSKILELAKETGGKVATTDFNLNKVAALQ